MAGETTNIKHFVFFDINYRCPKCGATMQAMMLEKPDQSMAAIACRNYRCANHDVVFNVMRIRVEVERDYTETHGHQLDTN